MTKYRAEYFEGGSWRPVGVFDTMTEAEIAAISGEAGAYTATRVIPIEDSCCKSEQRSINGGCLNCGDPSL